MPNSLSLARLSSVTPSTLNLMASAMQHSRRSAESTRSTSATSQKGSTSAIRHAHVTSARGPARDVGTRRRRRAHGALSRMAARGPLGARARDTQRGLEWGERLQTQMTWEPCADGPVPLTLATESASQRRVRPGSSRTPSEAEGRRVESGENRSRHRAGASERYVAHDGGTRARDAGGTWSPKLPTPHESPPCARAHSCRRRPACPCSTARPSACAHHVASKSTLSPSPTADTP